MRVAAYHRVARGAARNPSEVMMAIDWKNLEFSYTPTTAHVMCEYRNGAWGELRLETNPVINLHIAASCLHYGQSCFEGLKAFQRKDGSIGVFRPQENARRMMLSAKRIVMEAPSVELFTQAVLMAVRANKEFVPPYGTGASLYVRPLLIGTTPRIGLKAADDFTFLVMVTPVGPYYKNGFYPVKAVVEEELDRAAPRGVGNVKVAGNYAAGLLGDVRSKAKGFPITLYLDSVEHSYIDEFGTSNFLGITKSGSYVTPESGSILPSITNSSLMEIASELGLRVERRRIHIGELTEFAEVGACGTAAVITPIYSVTHGSRVYTFGDEAQAGEILTKLFTRIQSIQYGESEDSYQWMVTV